MENDSNTTELVVIGGSAGSLPVILEMTKKLKKNVELIIVIVVHRKAQSSNILQSLLLQYSALEVIEIEDKTEIKKNKIYIVPADYHLLFDNKKIASLDRSEKVHYSRPSIDITFRSAAEVFGESTVGILLSGANADGVEGLQHIKNKNGKIWIQNPETAEVAYMPKQAMNRVKYDLLFSPEELSKLIENLHNKH